MGVLVVFPFLWSNLPIFSGNIASHLVESGMPSIPARSKLVGEQTSGWNFRFAAGDCGGWCSLSVVVRQQARAQMTWAWQL